MPCVTHHHACECRERRMELLEAVAKAAKECIQSCQCCNDLVHAVEELEKD